MSFKIFILMMGCCFIGSTGSRVLAFSFYKSAVTGELGKYFTFYKSAVTGELGKYFTFINQLLLES